MQIFKFCSITTTHLHGSQEFPPKFNFILFSNTKYKSQIPTITNQTHPKNDMITKFIASIQFDYLEKAEVLLIIQPYVCTINNHVKWPTMLKPLLVLALRCHNNPLSSRNKKEEWATICDTSKSKQVVVPKSMAHSSILSFKRYVGLKSKMWDIDKS